MDFKAEFITVVSVSTDSVSRFVSPVSNISFMPLPYTNPFYYFLPIMKILFEMDFEFSYRFSEMLLNL